MSKLENIFDLLNFCVTNTEGNKLVGTTNGEGVNFLTQSNYKAKIESVSLALINIGVKKGTKVGIYLSDGLVWHLIDMSIMLTGSISVPIYKDNVPSNFIDHILDTDCECVFVEDLDIFTNHFSSLEKLKLKYVVTMNEGNIRSLPLQIQVIKFDELKMLGEGLLKKDIQTLYTIANQIQTEDIATIIATSGTTDQKKYAMISHRALINVLKNLESTFMTAFNKDDRSLLILPLAHILGRINSLLHLVFLNQIVFPASHTNIFKALNSSSPTVLIGFPKILKRISSHIKNNLYAQKNIVIKKSLLWSKKVLDQYYAKLENDLAPTTLEIFNRNLAQKIIVEKIKKLLGGKLKLIISGGGALSVDVYKILRNSNILVIEGYGLTETCGPCIVNPPYKQVLGSIGLPIKNNFVKLSSNQEILIASNSLFSGYYKPSSNYQLEAGFFNTSDLGALTNNGFLKFIERQQNVIKTPEGLIIYPTKIESVLEEEIYISHSVVAPYNNGLIAILGLDTSQLSKHFEASSLSFPENYLDRVSHPVAIELAKQEIKNANMKLSKNNRITNIAICPVEISLDNGLLTYTLRVRRSEIFRLFDTFPASSVIAV